MPNKSFKYFVKDKTQDLLIPSVYAYFDFDNSGNYNNLLLDNQTWINAPIKINASGTNIWENSGFANFDGSYKMPIDNLNYQNVGFLIPYYLENKKNNIFLSSKIDSGVGYASGYIFGLNNFNSPYVEFYDYIGGPTTYCLHERLNNTGILYFAVKNDFVELGYYNPVQKQLKKYPFPKNKNSVFNSKSWFLGGNIENDNSNFLSGQISQLAMFDSESLDVWSYEKNIISGLTHDLDTYTSTGYISGQTGILYGDVIVLTGCYYFYALSGEFYSGTQLTGISYYSTKQTLFDCLGREYDVYTNHVLSGYFSGFRWIEYLKSNCFVNTGYKEYEFSSGFVIDYSIKTILPVVKYPEIDNFYANKIFLKEPIDSTDKLSINSLKQINRSIDYGNTLYNIFNKTYFIDGDLNTNNLSGFYYNGQLLTISSTYQTLFQNGKIIYLPDKDFFISGSTIYTNKYYDFGNVNIDTWPTFDFIITGFISSGSAMPGVNFGNQMVFLNGQKLNSGIDYVNNTLLINIPSGYNILSITRNKLNFYEKNIINSGGVAFDVGMFTKNTSSVWLNGLRLKNEKDYEELLYDSDIHNIFIKNKGVLIYSKNGN